MQYSHAYRLANMGGVSNILKGFCYSFMSRNRLPLSGYCTGTARSAASESVDTAPPGATADGEPVAGAANAASAPAHESTAAQMHTKLAELQSQLSALDDKYKRSLAERENVRTRLEKQVADARSFGIQSFCKDLLDVADILGRATESVPVDQLTDANPHLKNLFEGLKMTEAQLLSVFRRHGLEQVNALGEKFDPNLHEALFEQPVEGHTPGHVCVVTKQGFTLHGRTIRPAQVGVAKAL